MLRQSISAILLVSCFSPTGRAELPSPGKPEVAAPACGESGRLTTELFGGIQGSLDWQAGDLACEGMPRPDDEGARLKLSGPYKSGDSVTTLTFILGLPDLEAGQTGDELPTNVTLMEEGSGRFFGTPDADGCWTDVTEQKPADSGEENEFLITGSLYCVSPLAELNGGSSVNFTELNFTGRVTWVPAK